MTKIATKYMGFELASPLILGSCGLSNHIDNLKIAEDSGFGAVVLKSIFEEEIRQQVKKLFDESDSTYYDPTAYDYLAHYQEKESFDKHLHLIREAKDSLQMPVIASINCYSSHGWMKYAKMIEEAGAEALEVNFFLLPTDFNKNAEGYRKEYFYLIEQLKENLNIPIALKTSFYFTDLSHFMMHLSYSGLAALVLFNRFHAPDINIQTLEYRPHRSLSSTNELNETLRWIGLLSQQLRCDIAATTGVQNGEGMIKLLLAGADAVQAASIFYKNGITYATTMIKELKEWMTKQNFKTIDEFKATLNFRNIDNPSIYFRTQFMKYMAGLE